MSRYKRWGKASEVAVRGHLHPIFYTVRAVGVFLKALSWYVVASSPQHGENTAFLSSYSQGVLLVIPLEF